MHDNTGEKCDYYVQSKLSNTNVHIYIYRMDTSQVTHIYIYILYIQDIYIEALCNKVTFSRDTWQTKGMLFSFFLFYPCITREHWLRVKTNRCKNNRSARVARGLHARVRYLIHRRYRFLLYTIRRRIGFSTWCLRDCYLSSRKKISKEAKTRVSRIEFVLLIWILPSQFLLRKCYKR